MALAGQGFTGKRPTGKVATPAPPEGRRPTRCHPARLGERRRAIALHAVLLAPRPVPVARARHAGVGDAPPVRVLGPSGVAPAGRAATVAPMEDGAAPPRSAVTVAQRARAASTPATSRRCSTRCANAALSPRVSSTDPGKKDRAVVGVQQGQADARVPVLDGPGDGEPSRRLRARLRRARASDPCGGARRADPFRTGSAQGAARDRRPRARRRDGGRPDQLLHAQHPEEPGRDR